MVGDRTFSGRGWTTSGEGSGPISRVKSHRSPRLIYRCPVSHNADALSILWKYRPSLSRPLPSSFDASNREKSRARQHAKLHAAVHRCVLVNRKKKKSEIALLRTDKWDENNIWKGSAGAEVANWRLLPPLFWSLALSPPLNSRDRNATAVSISNIIFLVPNFILFNICILKDEFLLGIAIRWILS